MKSPDKIYIEQYSDGVFSTEWHKYTHSTENTIAHEYLRKDALLEWAKGEIMPGNSAEGKGWNMAMQTLIDKIESL